MIPERIVFVSRGITVFQILYVAGKLNKTLSNTSVTRWQSGGVEDELVNGLLNPELTSRTPLYPRCSPRQVYSV